MLLSRRQGKPSNLLAGEKPLNEAEASQEAAMIKDSAKEEMQALEAEAPMNEAKYSIDHAIRNGQIKNFVTTLAKPYQEVFVAVVNLIKAEQTLLGNDEATSEANEMKLIQDIAIVFEAVLHYLYTGKQNFGPAEVALKDIRAFGERVLKLIIDSPRQLQVPVINVMRAVANAVLYAPLRNLNGRMNAAGKSLRHFGLNAASTWSQQLMALAPKLWTEVYNPKELVGWASRFIRALEGSETDAVKQLSQ